MSRLTWLPLLFVLAVLAAPAAAQQEHVADETTLEALVQEKLDEDDANRAAVRKLFERPEVRDVADRMGLTPARVEAASATLDSEELRLLASYARTFDQDLVGGQWGGTVTWFAIIAVLVVVIVLFAIAG